MKTLKIWCNAHLPEALAKHLEQSVAPHELVWSSSLHKSNLAGGGSDPQAREADIIYGQPSPQDLISSGSLKWVHLTTAGYTRYDTDELRSALNSRGAILTNSSTVFADPCAEHILGLMLAQARVLAPMFVNSATAHQWPYLETRAESRLLRGTSALLVGFGAIARRLVELLSPFEMKLAAVRRNVVGDEPIRVFPTTQLENVLDGFDHVINILPAALGTSKIFDGSRFARMKRGATFYNVGRGDTVDQDALCDALENGHLGAAYLDVTSPEPLPPEHRLWKAPNCWITPHTAGGHDREVEVNVEHFLDNLRRYLNARQLKDRVM
jgi:phosphoglycerate dehydrogenase-like enzyme